MFRIRKNPLLFLMVGAGLAACNTENYVYSPPDTSGAELRLAGLSECEGTLEGAGLAGERSDRLLAVVENGRVSFEHSGARFNCCLDNVSLALEIDGNCIRVLETEHTAEPCRCVCDFSVGGEITGLGNGSYVLEICLAEADNIVLSTVQFTITGKKGE